MLHLRNNKEVVHQISRLRLATGNLTLDFSGILFPKESEMQGAEPKD